MYASLCGTYTIGGASPNFSNFTEAATALNLAGVTCPVTFKVRPGVYNEQIQLYDIAGASLLNTVTFESHYMAVIRQSRHVYLYIYMIQLRQDASLCDHIIRRNLDIGNHL